MPEKTDANDAALSFDLTEQPWIEVLRRDGTQDELSLREVFAQADGVRRIAGDLPTQEFALLRLLLVIAHDAVEGPRDIEHWSELWSDPQCFGRVDEYLDTHRDCFDLFGAETPFFQAAGLRTAKDEVFSLNRIVADVPNGEPYFSARMPTVDRLGFAEAARWVVHAHAYDTSGIKSGVDGDARAKGGKVYPLGVGWAGNLGGVFVEGDTLRETLLLNLVAADTGGLRFEPADRPAWRREPSGPGGAERTPTGVRDLYTWQSRRMRLHADSDGVHGVVLGNGDPLNARNKHVVEPMTAWRRSEAQEKKHGEALVYLPREHDPERAAWRGLASLIADRAQTVKAGSDVPAFLRPGVLEWIARLVTEGELPRGFLVRARIIGARYGTQQSVIDEVVDDHLTMGVILLHQQDREYAQQAIDAVTDADEAVKVLGDLATDLERAAGKENESPRAVARDRAFGALEGPYRAWLAGLATAEDPYEERTRWQCQVHRIVSRLGDQLIADAGEAAWVGRTLPTKQGSVWLNSALAHRWFRARLGKCLGHPNDDDQPSGAQAPATADSSLKVHA
ncbi:type I-E CRISPR-associated protein Cse1/CasA [Streptomyces lateritius]|uniref:type I-E CRISPR-associated protein Cse1/CasA n=1 Tax=Streptomyces lateritius TaxID=67313 RepID=UPI00167906B7|nr:type I-E CRISPR-associated protein Cse1/CasA [Streptomyces lateritius]GGU12590.1 type I-E CRISPR-associated protein Cse1/CasA [Streptomyces lateritius]